MRHINNNGGLTKLYELAKENKTIKEVSLELEVPQVYIREYLKEQGISGWQTLVNEARGFKYDYSILDEKGGIVFIIDQLINGKTLKSISENLNVPSKFISDYLVSKGTSATEIRKYISKWSVEVGLENFGGLNYIKNNLKVGLSLDEISEECRISPYTLSKYLKEHS